ncbi:MAG: hypothetical protein JOS17DRAFT_751821 [Linnemannia elongata]|nr:MAG: hypothetical protein JOS17DRAFT_751821 [Linnemannia elongata]
MLACNASFVAKAAMGCLSVCLVLYFNAPCLSSFVLPRSHHLLRLCTTGISVVALFNTLLVCFPDEKEIQLRKEEPLFLFMLA